MRASNQSSFRVPWIISFTCRAFATITSWPKLFNKRLTQGERVPTSSAIRQRVMAPNTCAISFFVLCTLRSHSTWPL